MVVTAGLLLSQPGAMAGTYREFAMGLAEHPPAGTAYREDLEAELLRLANAYRASEGKKPLKAGDDFVVAARAHAADMMLHNFMGHRASTGHEHY